MIEGILDPDSVGSVGDDELDAQHGALLRLGQRAASPFGQDSDHEAHKLLNDLVEALESHFETEERKLAAAGYPGLAAHQSLHFEIREKLADLLIDAMLGKCTPGAIAAFVVHWVEEHEMVADARFADYITSAQVKSAPASRGARGSTQGLGMPHTGATRRGAPPILGHATNTASPPRPEAVLSAIVD